MFVLLGTNVQDLFADPESKTVMVHTAVRKLAGFNPKSPEVVASVVRGGGAIRSPLALPQRDVC
jgi:hypothetical protein